GSGYIVTSIGKDSGEIPFTAYSTTRSYMKNNKDLIQRFTNAVVKSPSPPAKAPAITPNW
ncbi:hypothetical protein ACTPEF_27550, partial [Clostridioides difficile]